MLDEHNSVLKFSIVLTVTNPFAPNIPFSNSHYYLLYNCHDVDNAQTSAFKLYGGQFTFSDEKKFEQSKKHLRALNKYKPWERKNGEIALYNTKNEFPERRFKRMKS